MLLVPAVLALTAVVVAVGTRELYAVPGFAGVALVSGAAGLALQHRRHASGVATVRQSLGTVALGWLVVSLLCALPFHAAAHAATALHTDPGSAAVFSDWWSAWFEGMSSVTSTGLTMVEAESQLPHGLQWWRSVLQWAGGAGVVVFVLAMSGGEGGYRLYEAEGRHQLLGQDIQATARRIFHIFIGLTLFSVLALLAAGAEPWVALNHGLTGISTGGMVVTDNSFVDTATPLRLAAMVIMVLGALSYGSFGLLADRDIRAFLRLTQVRALAVGLLAGGSALVLTLRALDGGPGALDAAFLWVSALTTSGFTTVQIPALPVPVLPLLLLGMFVGGAAGSTTGGVKLRRAAWLAMAVARSPRLLYDSNGGSRPWRIDGRVVDEADSVRAVAAAGALAAAYLVTLAAGAFLLSLSTASDTPLKHVIFECMSALNTVGLTAGVTGPGLPWHAKAELIALMWMGRLEVLAVAILVGAPLLAAVRRAARLADRHEEDS